ncbi:MAG: hypothetical protein ACXWCC_14960, partial [Caldimonas sp.]
VWALAAIVLPWLVRGRLPALDAVRVVLWSAVVCSVTVAVVRSTHVLGTPSTAIVGALAGGLVALAPSIRWVPRPWHDSASRGVAGAGRAVAAQSDGGKGRGEEERSFAMEVVRSGV